MKHNHCAPAASMHVSCLLCTPPGPPVKLRCMSIPCRPVATGLTLLCAVQVHVAGKGFALGSDEQMPSLERALEQPVTVSGTGGPNGGWDVTFISPSSQLGASGSAVYARLQVTDSSGEAPDSTIFMLPEPSDEPANVQHSKRPLLLVLCNEMLGARGAGEDGASGVAGKIMAPILFGASPDPAVQEVMTGSEAVLKDPLKELAEQYALALPEHCVLYSLTFQHALIHPENATFPAPPVSAIDIWSREQARMLQDVDGTWSDAYGPWSDADGPWSDANEPWSDADGPWSDANAPWSDADGPLSDADGPSSDGSPGVVARRLRQASPVASAELVVNGQTVAASDLQYDASAGPVLYGVTPSVISAAMPEVCTNNALQMLLSVQPSPVGHVPLPYIL